MNVKQINNNTSSSSNNNNISRLASFIRFFQMSVDNGKRHSNTRYCEVLSALIDIIFMNL